MISTIPGVKAEIRPYQERLVEKAVLKYEQGLTSVLIEAPTGSGKSLMGLAIARLLQDKLGCGIGWVAMRRQLLKQAVKENDKMGTGLDFVPISMFQHTLPTHDHKGRLITMLVTDEGHHEAVASMAHILNTLQPKYVLGLTATPFRTDRLKLCFNAVLKDAGIHQLISQGYLSPYRQYTIDRWTVDSVCETYLREPHRWGKSAIYWHRRDNAINCCQRLQAAGIRAATIFGDDPFSLREQRLDAFESGDLQVLVNMILLTEGWDCPDLQTVFVRDSVKGPTMQMAGRVFRKYPGIPYKQVVQSKLTHWPIHRTAEAADSFLWMGDGWRSYKASVNVDHVTARAVTAIARSVVEMPKWLEAQKAKTQRRRRGGEREIDGIGQRPNNNPVAIIH